MSSVRINKSKSVLNIISHHLSSNEVELCVENFRSPGRSIRNCGLQWRRSLKKTLIIQIVCRRTPNSELCKGRYVFYHELVDFSTESTMKLNHWTATAVTLFLFALGCIYKKCKTVPGGVLGISSDGDDRRIFLGLKFSSPGFFWVRKFGLGSLIWVEICLGY